MGMYLIRPDLTDPHDLYQGDILVTVIRPRIVAEKNFCLRRGSHLDWPAPSAALAALDPNLRVMTEVERIDAMVISSTCDNAGAKYPFGDLRS